MEGENEVREETYISASFNYGKFVVAKPLENPCVDFAINRVACGEQDPCVRVARVSYAC